ncbi:hypothetical protein RCS94_09120 [Orbaceae bacterium ac157xtp]
MLIVPSSYGVLSAVSANTIKGNAPWFTEQSGAKKLGFKIGNIVYSESEGNLSSSPSVVNYFNAELTLNDFKVMNLTSNDFDPATDYYDADGDEAHSITPFLMSASTYYEWRDRRGEYISSSKYDQTLGCGSSLNFPLTLKIRSRNVKVRSRYGDPNESTPVDLVKTYNIGTIAGFCFAQPNAMIVYSNTSWMGYTNSGGSLSWNWNSGSSTPHPSNGGGYTTDFDPVNGFKASATTKFPTTGFPKAKFRLLMISDASEYVFTSDNVAVTVDTHGDVTLNRKPTEPVTIKAVLKSDSSQVYTYTFDPTNVWVVPKFGRMDYAQAKTACGGELRIPSRAELTNSPSKNAAQDWVYSPNTYTRSIDGSIFGEWGYTNNSTYPDSLWTSGFSWYWTRDPYSSKDQFLVFSSTGNVSWFESSNSYQVACLE